MISEKYTFSKVLVDILFHRRHGSSFVVSNSVVWPILVFHTHGYAKFKYFLFSTFTLTNLSQLQYYWLYDVFRKCADQEYSPYLKALPETLILSSPKTTYFLLNKVLNDEYYSSMIEQEKTH